MRAQAILLLVALLAAGCVAPRPDAAPRFDFPTDPDAGTTFAFNASGPGLFALKLTAERDGAVGYRILVRENGTSDARPATAHADACLLPGWDADLWWANHTVPVRGCERHVVIQTHAAQLDAGPWSLVIRAYACGGNCTVSVVVQGATLAGTMQGPPDMARIEALDAARCPMC